MNLKNATKHDRQLELFNENIKLVHYVIHNKIIINKKIGYTYDDYFQVGSIGLWKACLNYDPSKSIAFSTFAVRAILNEIYMVNRSNKNSYYLDIISFETPVNTKIDDMVLLKDTIKCEHAMEVNYFSLSTFNLFLNQLKRDSDKNMFKLRFMGKSQKQIATELGITQATVSRRLKKFRELFCEIMRIE